MSRPSWARVAVLVSGIVASVPAFAADLPRREVVPVAAPRPSTFTWTGIYVGANVGYGARTGKDYSLAVRPGYFPTSAVTAGTITSERAGDGIVGGAQIGYNRQFGNWVLGIENDVQYVDFGKRRGSYSFAGTGAVPAGFDYLGPEKKIDFIATGRARVGYAFDRFLVYGTAGLSYGSFEKGNCGAQKCDSGKIGYAVGGGVEYALTDKWSVKVEGLYVNLGKTAPGVIGSDAAGRIYTDLGRKIDNDIVLARAGVNYRF